jgi:hypothetical protein
MNKNEIWFIVDGCATPISADSLQPYYHIIRVVKGSYDLAVYIHRQIFYS